MSKIDPKKLSARTVLFELSSSAKGRCMLPEFPLSRYFFIIVTSVLWSTVCCSVENAATPHDSPLAKKNNFNILPNVPIQTFLTGHYFDLSNVCSISLVGLSSGLSLVIGKS